MSYKKTPKGALAPVIVRVGGDALVDTAARAVMQATAQWP